MIMSPLESFRVIKILGIHSPLLGFDYSLTNNSVYVLLAIIVVALFVLSINLGALVPSAGGVLSEVLYSSTLTMSRSTLGNQAMLPIVFALFITILSTNMISNVPYGYAVASSIAVSLGLSLVIFIAATSIAIYNKGVV